MNALKWKGESGSVLSNSLGPHDMEWAHQIPLSMELSKQEYRSGLLFPSLGVFPRDPTQGSKPKIPHR